MPKTKLANFLINLSEVSDEDGLQIEEVLHQYGWNPVSQYTDPYEFVLAMDFYNQRDIIQELFMQFHKLSAHERDMLFGMLIWCADDETYDYLLRSSPAVQNTLKQICADRAMLPTALQNFGCDIREYKMRVHFCWEMVESNFNPKEEGEP